MNNIHSLSVVFCDVGVSKEHLGDELQLTMKQI